MGMTGRMAEMTGQILFFRVILVCFWGDKLCFWGDKWVIMGRFWCFWGTVARQERRLFADFQRIRTFMALWLLAGVFGNEEKPG